MYLSSKVAIQSRYIRDRNVVLLLVGLVWLAIGAGFGPDIATHILSRASPYPLIVHAHALAFVGWLVLLTVQVLLIRNNLPQLHRQLGIGGIVLAAAMMILGPTTALYGARVQFGTPQSDPLFLLVQLTDMVAFAGLVLAAVPLRKVAASHKRLILLATIYLTDARFGRITGTSLEKQLGSSFWPFFGEVYSVWRHVDRGHRNI